MQDRVFTSLNARRKWLGADYRLAMVCAGVAVVLMSILGSVWKPVMISMLLWVIGALCEKRDPRFFEFFPLRFQLKSRYEAGRRQ